MRFAALTRAAFAALLTAALWLPASYAHAQDASAAATRAYLRIEPALREMVTQGMATGMSLDGDPRFAACPQVGQQLSKDMQTGVLPVVVDLFFSGDNRRRIEAILADTYSAEQLKRIAASGEPPADQATMDKFDQSLASLQIQFLDQIMQDSRVVAEMTKVVQASVLLSLECRTGAEN